jgi:hypothetical protein
MMLDAANGRFDTASIDRHPVKLDYPNGHHDTGRHRYDDRCKSGRMSFQESSTSRPARRPSKAYAPS